MWFLGEWRARREAEASCSRQIRRLVNEKADELKQEAFLSQTPEASFAAVV